MIPENATKDHNFILFLQGCLGCYFKCSACHVKLFVPFSKNYWKYSFYSERIIQLGFYYWYPNGSYNVVENITGLSCVELQIRDIIL